eukprot:8325699-Prorocentrum_lima.AAC.1
MTSSLVGSEMCIRDSPCPQVVVGGWPPRHCPVGPDELAWPWRAAKPPVSYTHLTLPTICSV